ncbi:MAG: hypothetical protein ABI120_06055, partial [Gemmatimonadaceae bacterium]
TAAERPKNKLQPNDPKKTTAEEHWLFGCSLFFGIVAAVCSSAVRLHQPLGLSAFRLQLK